MLAMFFSLWNLQQTLQENQVLFKLNIVQKPVFSHFYVNLATNPLFQKVQSCT